MFAIVSHSPRIATSLESNTHRCSTALRRHVCVPPTNRLRLFVLCMETAVSNTWKEARREGSWRAMAPLVCNAVGTASAR
eukprot:6204734-Amphidinium_carterae.2